MAELDLVPPEWRRGRRLRRWLHRFGLLYGGLLVAILVVQLGLVRAVSARRAELERLEAAEALALQQQAQLEELDGERRTLRARVSMLRALRGGIAAREIFLALDQALAPEIRFLRWSFARAGEQVDEEPKTVRAGYFLVVPQQSEDEGEDAGWLLQTRVEVHGLAPDHARLADFVSRLVQQPEIEDVRIIDTRVRQYTEAQVVDFELAVVVRSASS